MTLLYVRGRTKLIKLINQFEQIVLSAFIVFPNALEGPEKEGNDTVIPGPRGDLCNPFRPLYKRRPFGSALKKSIFVPSGYKVYEQYCPINDDPSFARYFISEEKYREMESFAVKARDFLISCSGVTLGRITQIPDNFEQGIINQALLRVRVNNGIVKDNFFLKLFRSPYFQRQIFKNATGSAIPNVKGVGELKAIPVPLPPIEEQQVIVQFVDECMTFVSEIEKQIDKDLRRAKRLRQSILKKAFTGKLVAQGDNDDPTQQIH